MYLLSEMQYDYYEFETPLAVSASKEALIQEFNRLMDEDRALGYSGGATLVTSVADHVDMAKYETPHYYIAKIREVYDEV